MNCSIAWPWELVGKHIDGPAVIIDDICQSTNATLLLQFITKKYYLVNSTNWKQALEFHPGAVQIGESVDTTIPFVVSNSAAKIFGARQKLRGNVIHHMSNNGSKRVYEAIALGAAPLYGACFGNLVAVAEFLLRQTYKSVTIIPSGGSEPFYVDRGKTDLPEDKYCAQALQNMLHGKQTNVDDYIQKVKDELPEYYLDQIPYDVLPFSLAAPDSFQAIPEYKMTGDGFVEVENAN